MNDKLNIDISGTVNGSVLNNGTVNTAVYNKENKSSFYKEWWFISLSVGTIGFGLIWWIFNSLFLSIFVAILIFITMLMFNPKRRFFRVALSTLFLGLFQFSSFSGLLVIPENDFIHGFIKINELTIPWFGILLIVTSIILFILDYKLNKEKR
jgi:hypothetical protein